ncbi:MAG: ParB N-terminal domain-containing protein [Streptosporangiaceae bacterium]
MSSYQVMPDLTAEEYEALKADIAEHGVRVPVDVDEDGVILDGHHRKAIAAELGIDCPTRVVAGLTEEEKRHHALAVNIARRQLTREQRRELIAAEIDRDPSQSDRAIARACGCSPSTVGAVRRGEVSNLDTPEPDAAHKRAERRAAKILASLKLLDRRIFLLLLNRTDPRDIAGWLTTAFERVPDEPAEARERIRELTAQRVTYVLMDSPADIADVDPERRCAGRVSDDLVAEMATRIMGEPPTGWHWIEPEEESRRSAAEQDARVIDAILADMIGAAS